MKLALPCDDSVNILKYDKFGVVRPKRIDPFQKPHSGVDLRPHQNGGSMSVYAVADGVIAINTANDGSYYHIDHGYVQGLEKVNGTKYYGQLRANYVHITRPLPVGTRVRKGQKIAEYLPGDSAHLHFSLFAPTLQNPEEFLFFNEMTQEQKNQLKLFKRMVLQNQEMLVKAGVQKDVAEKVTKNLLTANGGTDGIKDLMNIRNNDLKVMQKLNEQVTLYQQSLATVGEEKAKYLQEIAKLEKEIEKLQNQKPTQEIEIGQDTRNWVEKLLNIFK